MKKVLLIILLCLISLAIGYWIGYMLPFAEGVKNDAKKHKDFTDSILQNETDENFDLFIDKFITDSSFQFERIKFPLIFTVLKNADTIDTTFFKISDWKFIRLYANQQFKDQLYDNFEREMANTDERVYCREGIENGIYEEYKFKRIDKLWYLIEINDLST